MTKTVTVQAQQKWEYLGLTRKSVTYLVGEINVFGQEGWELVSVFYYKDMKGLWCWTGFLKRPCTGQSSTPAGIEQAELPADEPPTTDQPPKKTEEPPASSEGFDLGGDEFKIHSE
jgi:hypothetical protein